MVKPNEIFQVGSLAHQITSTRDNPQRYRVYLCSGICPALNCAQGGGRNPYIVIEEQDGNNKNKASHQTRLD